MGLPLALTFAREGLRVAVHDIDDEALAVVNDGRMPFLERGAEAVLQEVLGKTLHAANDPSLIGAAACVVVVIGTPVDEHLSPTVHVMFDVLEELTPRLRDGQCVILRSTVYPGTTEKVRDIIAASGKDIDVAFCPERVAEGNAMEELRTLPQIVSGCSDRAVSVASELFARIARSILHMTPLEAELTKIFANVWRYIQFATSNQFFMIATDFGLDFYKIYDALTRDYPRMAGLPKSGFAAGPCLFKDTMQLAAACNNNFQLGHAAMLINEGLPGFLIRHLKQLYPLKTMTVGVMGMAFKGDSDDPRESLSYKLRRLLAYEAADVLCTDVYIEDPRFVALDDLLERSDLLILGAPHREYRTLTLPEGKPVIDIWNVYQRGANLT